jgi:RNA polymerase sigma factor (sigma-70 family)
LGVFYWMKYTDNEIIQALKKGDDDAVLSFLYKDVLPKVKKYIKANKGNEDEAKDIFQDAVIIFYKKVKQDSFVETMNVTAYICLVSKNLWINRVKKMNKSIEMPENMLISSEEDLLSNIITEEKRNALTGLLSQIGEECRKLLKYSVYDNLSMKEICHKLGYSSENVAKTYNYRCKQKLVQLVMKNKEMVNLLKR